MPRLPPARPSTARRSRSRRYSRKFATTIVPAMPFDYVDYDVKIAEKPQKYYRVRQP